MAPGDRRIFETDRCTACSGSGWTWWSPTQPHEDGKWVVCRGCLGTGRTDQTGEKQPHPLQAPAAEA